MWRRIWKYLSQNLDMKLKIANGAYDVIGRRFNSVTVCCYSAPVIVCCYSAL